MSVSASHLFVNGEVLVSQEGSEFNIKWNLQSGFITLIEERKKDDSSSPCPHSNLLLCAGFIDIQVNGLEDIDVRYHNSSTDASVDEIYNAEAWSRLNYLLLAQGTTSWLPTAVTSEMTEYPAIIKSVELAQLNSSPSAPSILGLHLEGPNIGTAHGAHASNCVVPIDLNWIRSLPPIVKLVTLGPEQDEAEEATRILVQDKSVVVSLGHTKASEEQILRCKRAGASLVTHLFNAMSGVHHRDPAGVALVALTDDDLHATIIADLHHGE